METNVDCDVLCLYVYDRDNDFVSDIYWKNEHRLMCSSDTCTADERNRYEKSVYAIILTLYIGLGIPDIHRKLRRFTLYLVISMLADLF